MTKKRHNIDTIAEILIDKINDFEKSANKIGQLVKTLQESNVKIDTSTLERLNRERNEREIAFLSDFKTLTEKKYTRLPNWLLTLILVLFVLVLAFSVYAWNQVDEIKTLKQKVEYYESKKE